MPDKSVAPYFRRDQAKGITPPELSKDCTYAEHIVRARGKRTRFTSVSLDQNRIVDFGPTLYEALRDEVDRDGHQLVEHGTLMAELKAAANNGEKADRLRALQAQRYAARRKEGLISWKFDASRIDRKDLFVWTTGKVAKYFRTKKNG